MQVFPRLVRFGHLSLYEIGQHIRQPFRQRRTIMSPTPHAVSANLEASRGRGVATEGHFKHKIKLAAGKPTLEA